MLERSASRVEQRECTLAVSIPAPPYLHPRLVEVGDRAQRARALLVKHVARLLEPLPRLVNPAGERTESRQ
jgi:hypothetical protein